MGCEFIICLSILKLQVCFTQVVFCGTPEMFALKILCPNAICDELLKMNALIDLETHNLFTGSASMLV
jgi:hypothetical protein